MQKGLILKQLNDLRKQAGYLAQSISKYRPYEPDKQYSSSELEYYDALSFRFEKTVELFINTLRGLELYLFGEQSDTLRNCLRRLEKAGIVKDVEFIFSCRILRNKIAHTYLPHELKELYQQMVDLGKELINQIEEIYRTLTNTAL